MCALLSAWSLWSFDREELFLKTNGFLSGFREESAHRLRTPRAQVFERVPEGRGGGWTGPAGLQCHRFGPLCHELWAQGHREGYHWWVINALGFFFFKLSWGISTLFRTMASLYASRTRVRRPPRPHQHWMYLVLLTAVLTGEWWYLVVVLHCVPDNQWCWASFHMPVGHPCFPQKDTCSNPLPIFKSDC